MGAPNLVTDSPGWLGVAVLLPNLFRGVIRLLAEKTSGAA